MYIIVFILGICVGFLLLEMLKSFVILNVFRQLETQILFIAITLNQYKFHAMKIVEIAYSADENKKEECEQILSKIQQKFDSYGDSLIENLISRLPYKTEYNDWKTAIVYIDQLITKNKQSE